MLNPGQVFGRFEVIALIGRGGMGDVYEARDTKLDRIVALKIVRVGGLEHDTAKGAAARLLREARAAAAVVHPNAVAILDVGDVEGTPYLAMERLRGKTLRAYVGDANVPMKTRLRWLVEIANALGAAHAKGIVHRDVKPENVIVTEDGVAKVLDFGLARVVALVDRAAVTQTGVELFANVAEPLRAAAPTEAGIVLGTPDYMSPEQLRGELVDARSDQWSWGVTAYELVSGRRPWPPEGDLVVQVGRILNETPSKLEARECPKNVRDAIVRCLQRDPRERHDDMACAVASAIPRDRPSLARRLSYAVGAFALLGIVVASARFGTLETKGVPPRLASRVEASPPSQAEALFEAGMQALRDGSKRAALNDFDAAIALDPRFAAAHLRWALSTVLVDEETRGHFDAARANRFRLNPHDAPLIDAVEPWMRNVPDLAEAERRLTSLQSDAGFDADYMLVRANFRAMSGNSSGALADLDELIRRQAISAETFRLRGKVMFDLNRGPESKADFERCVEISPSAASCLQHLDDFYADNGDCERAEIISRRLIAIDPREPRWYMFLARALFGRGAPAVAVREAIQRAYADVHTDLERIKELTDFASLDFLQGDVRALDEGLAAWEALAAKSSVDDVHYTFMRFKTWALFEENRPDDAATEAAAYLRRRSGLIVDPIDTDSSIFAYQVLYRAGRISRSQMGMSRAAWLRGVTGELSGNVWVWGFADGIVDEQDAAEAFGVLRRFVPLPDEQIRSIRFDEPIGNALLEAGRPAEAVAVLRRATASCRALEFPFRYVHALVDLGIAYERINDVEAACSTFERVLALVPAKTRTLSAQAAGREIARLRCALK